MAGEIFLEDVKRHYNRKRAGIKKRLQSFSRMRKESDEKLFGELCFCLLTPQSKALDCDAAVKRLASSGLLFSGSAEDIQPLVKPIRFYKNKSRYIVLGRGVFSENGKVNVKDRLKGRSPQELREWLVEHVKGMGYKEASHFLRNVGLGEGLAILDRHILKNLEKCRVIKDVPKSLSKKTYLEVEEKMRRFSEKIAIPLGELDIVFWSMETGVIFK